MNEKTLKNIREKAVSELVRNNISRQESNIEADMLIKHVFNLKKKDIISQPDFELSCKKIKKFNNLVQLRIKERIPVQYLINKAYFMGHEFYVDENVLIPRPETELLVEEVLKLTGDKKLKIIDIGTGSGCIACMLAKYAFNAQITASDISEKALEVAKINAKNIGVENKVNFIKSDIFANINNLYDIIVSNPPYISIKERENLQIEVLKHEPHLALFVEDEQGVSFYKKLIEESKLRLCQNGYFAVEIGALQANYIIRLFNEAGFKDIKVIKDYNNVERIIIATASL